MNNRHISIRTALVSSLICGLISGLISGLSALAFTPDEQAAAVTAVYQDVAQTEAFVLACAQRFPDANTANQAALKDWKSRNGLQDFDRVLLSFSQKSPQIAAKIGEIKSGYVTLILKQSDTKLQPICLGLAKTLLQPNSNTIKADHAKDLEVIAQMARDLEAKPAVSPSSGNTGSSNAGSSNAGSGVSAKPTPGHYNCESHLQEFSNWAKDPNNPRIDNPRRFEFDLFANGEYQSLEANAPRPQIRIETDRTNILEWPKTMGRYRILEGRIAWQSGGFSDEYPFYSAKNPSSSDDKRQLRGGLFNNAKGTLILRWEDFGFSFKQAECKRSSNTQHPTPTQLMTEGENPETYLQPKSVKANSVAAKPEPGNGSLNGLYVSTGGDSRRPIMFFPNGQKWQDHDKILRWGFDQLDCARVPLPVKLQPLPKTLCEGYSIGDNSIEFGGRKFAFAKGPNGSIQIGDETFKPVKANPSNAMNAVLKYVWSGTNGTSGAYGEERLTLRPDGKFAFGRSSAGASFFSIAGTDYAVTSGNSGGTDGTYKILPYSIELSFSGGLKLRFSFYRDVLLDGSKYDGSFMLLSKTFSPDRK